MDNEFRSGFVTMLGRPNAGKSTLTNQLVGEKVAICSDKPQTTRNSIRGIYTDQRMQVVLIDTPGVHKPKFKLGERMMNAVGEALGGCDIVLYLVDATESFGSGEEYILKMLKSVKAPAFLIINKIDLLPHDKLLPLIAFYADKYDFAEVIPCSALTGDNTAHLLDVIYTYLHDGPKYYPDDMCSDFPESMLVAELVREQILRSTNDEVPHSVAVTVPIMEQQPNGVLHLEAIIYVERDSQKGIIIGKGGAMLKKIGSAARREIEAIFGCKAFLEMRVRAKKDWRNNTGLLDSWEMNE